MTLNKLAINTNAKVVNINCNAGLKRRFFDLGLINGTKVTSIFVSPFGDPTAYEFRGNIIAIRDDEAKKIIVKEED